MAKGGRGGKRANVANTTVRAKAKEGTYSISKGKKF